MSFKMRMWKIKSFFLSFLFQTVRVKTAVSSQIANKTKKTFAVVSFRLIGAIEVNLRMILKVSMILSTRKNNEPD